MPATPRLLFGPYVTPRVRIGQKVVCKIRGPSVIVGLSKGPIPWPLGRVPGNKQTMLIIYGALEKALRREAAIAVRYWWGTSSAPVVRWRKQLNVGITEGTAISRDEALNRVHLQRRLV